MTIIKHLRLVIIATVIMAVISSCQKNEEFEPLNQENQSFLTELDRKDMMELGKELENPYSVENMKKAYENLNASSTNGRSEEIEIVTTHLYVRFKPKNEAELSILQQDTTLISNSCKIVMSIFFV